MALAFVPSSPGRRWRTEAKGCNATVQLRAILLLELVDDVRLHPRRGAEGEAYVCSNFFLIFG